MRPSHNAKLRRARYAHRAQKLADLKGRSERTFLDLPAELRNQIYALALVREDNRPIDLWPTYGSDLARLKTRPALKKHCKDVSFVRKKLAPGLLRTCHQIRNEAAAFFWGHNHFTFCGKGGWHGLLRFLLTIGDDARTHLSQLSVHAPFFLQMTTGHFGYIFKWANLPRTRWVKLSEQQCEEKTVMKQACHLLARFEKLKTLRLDIPCNMQVEWCFDWNGTRIITSDSVIDALDHAIPYLQGLQMLKLPKISFVLHTNSQLKIVQGVHDILNQGWDFVCDRRSWVWERENDEDSRLLYIVKAGRLEGRRQEETKLTGQETLFQPLQGRYYKVYQVIETCGN